MATAEALVTSEEFAALPGQDARSELVRGRIIAMSPTNFRHGEAAGELLIALGGFVKQHGLGRVIGTDSGCITERNPDTVRAPDVAFSSAARRPPPEQRNRFPDIPPDLVFEVRSPNDRWIELVRKALEYLAAGVVVVVLLDPDAESAHVYRADEPPRILGPDDTLTFPDRLGTFALRVGAIFESLLAVKSRRGGPRRRGKPAAEPACG